MFIPPPHISGPWGGGDFYFPPFFETLGGGSWFSTSPPQMGGGKDPWYRLRDPWCLSRIAQDPETQTGLVESGEHSGG